MNFDGILRRKLLRMTTVTKRDYSKSKYKGNLLKDKEQMHKREKRSFNKSILFCLLIAVIIALIYWLFFSAYWDVKKIVISGTNQLDEIKKIEEMTDNFLNSQRFLILSQRNVFILSHKALQSVIYKNFDLEKVKIEIDKPETLMITIKKKVPVALWQEDNKYFTIYSEGILQQQIENVNEYNLPIVNYGTSTQVVIGDRYLSEQQIEFMQKIFDYFDYYFKDLKIKQFVVTGTQSREVDLITSAGWKIMLNIDLDAQKSLTVVSRILAEKVENQDNLQYIDMRVEGKVYYK